MGSESEQRCRLLQGMAELGLPGNPELVGRLLALIHLLSRWNRVYNLTAVRDPLRMVSHHLLDSLALAPYVRGPLVLDVGTGAGFPGLPLAILFPQGRFVLLDSRGKKLRFVRQAVIELGLTNVATAHTRIESYKTGEKFATIVARAFAPLPDILRLTQPLLDGSGVILAPKGRLDGAERDSTSLPQGALAVHHLRVPYVEGERSLVEFRTGDIHHDQHEVMEPWPG